MSSLGKTATIQRWRPPVVARIVRSQNNTRPHPLDKIHINPNVTRESQRELAQQLSDEIKTEKDLKTRTQEKQATKTRGLPVSDSARLFNEYCTEFVESSKETKEVVHETLNAAQQRLTELEAMISRLDELERESYRFEMALPSDPNQPLF